MKLTGNVYTFLLKDLMGGNLFRVRDSDGG
jgi:hypothetical protein